MYKITKVGLQAVAESPSFSLFCTYPDIGEESFTIIYYLFTSKEHNKNEIPLG